MIDARFTLLGPRTPAGLERRLVRVRRGAGRPYVAEDWRGAIAVLERGTIVLEHTSGERLRLDEGAVFWLAGMALVAIHNGGRDTAIIALGRRREAPS